MKTEPPSQQTDDYYPHDKCIILEAGHPYSSRGISSALFASAAGQRHSSEKQRHWRRRCRIR